MLDAINMTQHVFVILHDKFDKASVGAWLHHLKGLKATCGDCPIPMGVPKGIGRNTLHKTKDDTGFDLCFLWNCFYVYTMKSPKNLTVWDQITFHNHSTWHQFFHSDLMVSVSLFFSLHVHPSIPWATFVFQLSVPTLVIALHTECNSVLLF